MIKETDGDCFEDMRSLNQDLTFNSAIKEFELRDVEFKKQTLRLMDNDGLYSNLAFLLSDQCSYGIKAATFQGKDQSIFKDHKEFNGSIFKQMSELYEYIDLRNKTYTKIEGLYRVDKRDYPEVTIRESLMNILVHHDYSFSASCLVNIYDDRIEFISISGLVSGIELEDCLAGASICRNQNLANVFYQLNLIENYGTGLSKIMNSYQDCNIKPSIQTTKNSFKIILPNINETNDILVVNDYSFKYEIDDEKDVILNYLNTHDFITRKDVENLFFTSGPIAYRTLKKLVDEGLLTQKGKARNIKYFKAKK